jgi:oligosaccharide repeat unit polymerase
MLVSPIGFFAFFFALIYFFVPALQESLGLNTLRNEFYGTGSSQVLETLALALLYFTVCVLFFALARPHPGAVMRLKQAAMTIGVVERGLVPALLILQSMSLVATVWFIRSLSAPSYAILLARRTIELPGTGYLLDPVSLGYIAALLLAVPYFCAGRLPTGWRAVLIILAVLGGAIPSALLGKRLLAAIGIVYLGLAYAILRQKRLPAFRLAMLLLLIFAVIATMGVLRVQLLGSGAVNTELAQEQIYSPELLVNELASSFGQLEWLGFVINKRDQWEMLHGATYFSALATPIPRVLWSGKPIGAGPLLNHIVNPGGHIETAGGMTTGCVLEAYLNGGIIGIIIVAAIHGLCLCAVTNYSRHLKYRYQFVIYFLFLACFSEMLIYGEFYGVFTRIGLWVVPIWVYRSVMSIRISRSRTSHGFSRPRLA